MQKRELSIGDPRICMMSMAKESAAGANLTKCNHVIFVHPMHAPTQQLFTQGEKQAIGRVRRYGQTKDVYFYRFLCEETIDTEIHQKFVVESGGGHGMSNAMDHNFKPKIEGNFFAIFFTTTAAIISVARKNINDIIDTSTAATNDNNNDNDINELEWISASKEHCILKFENYNLKCGIHDDDDNNDNDEKMICEEMEEDNSNSNSNSNRSKKRKKSSKSSGKSSNGSSSSNKKQKTTNFNFILDEKVQVLYENNMCDGKIIKITPARIRVEVTLPSYSTRTWISNNDINKQIFKIE